MQRVLVALQQEMSSGYSIFIFVISLFGCPPCLDCPEPSPRLLGRFPHAPLTENNYVEAIAYESSEDELSVSFSP